MVYSTKTRMGIWKHIYGPVKGQISSIPSTLLPPEAALDITGMSIKDGEVMSEYGHVDYPTPGAALTNELDGVFMKFNQFYKRDGNSYGIAMTTTQLYNYNTSTTTWDCITQGTEINGCEAQWDAQTGISSSANGSTFLRGTYSAMHTILGSIPDLHFPLDDDAANTTVDETGTSDKDGTASANTDTLNATGVVSDGFDFEFATSHIIDIDTAAATILTDTEGSSAFWIKAESLTAARTVWGLGDTDDEGRLIIDITTAGAVRALVANGTATQWSAQTADSTISTGTWYHVAVVQDGTTPKIYVNAVDKTLTWNTATDITLWVAGATGVDNGRIGGDNYDGDGDANFFDGVMDDVRYYSSAITAAEVAGLYNTGKGTANIGGFSTGIISSEDLASTLDLSGAANTYISFWIRANATVAANVLQFRICEDVTGAATNTYNTFNIPALVADTWQHVTVNTKAAGTGTWPDDFNSVDSVALVAASDPGAITIYIDDIRTTKNFTGDEDNRFSVGTMDDTFIITNGIDQPQKVTYSGSAFTTADLTTTLNVGSITTSEIVLVLMDHILFMNNTENSANVPARVTWSNIGDDEDFVVGTAGYQDLTDETSAIIAAEKISRSVALIYRERSIVKCSWVGGQTPFRFETLVFNEGCLCKEGVISIHGVHHVIGQNNLYRYTGGGNIEPFDQSNNAAIFADLDRTYDTRVILNYVDEDKEFQVWLPKDSAYPDIVWCMNEQAAWYKRDRTMTGLGKYQRQSSVTIGDLVGTIGEQNYRIGDLLTAANAPITLVGDTNGKVYVMERGTYDNDGVAIINTFVTPDFTLPNTPEYQNMFMRITQLVYEARGQKVTVTYSTDGGSIWSPVQKNEGATTLTSSYNYYQEDFEVTARKIRFKFQNATVSSGFRFRYYGFYWIARSGRR